MMPSSQRKLGPRHLTGDSSFCWNGGREMEDCPEIWRKSCVDANMEQERRQLRLSARQWAWQWTDDNSLRLEFSLPAGAYATVVVREIVMGEGDG